MPNHDHAATIEPLLRSLKGLEPLKRLLWSELNYDRINQPLSRHDWTENQRALLAEDPLLFAAAGEKQDFHIIYARLQDDRVAGDFSAVPRRPFRLPDGRTG
jgi:hypothetical protein